jgi:hypothetical protein
MEILVGVVIAVIPAAGWLIEHRLQAARAAEHRLYEARRVLYQDILKPYTEVFQAIGAKPANAGELARKAQIHLASADHRIRINELMMMGSDQVIESFNRLVRFQIEVRAGELEEKPGDVLWLWSDLLLAIRKDVGDPRTNLSAPAMIEGWVQDMDVVFPQYDSKLEHHMLARPRGRSIPT